MQTVPFVLVHLLEIPPPGKAQLLARVSYDDHARVCEAAKLIGMTQSQFLRTVLIRAADKVLEEHGAITDKVVV